MGKYITMPLEEYDALMTELDILRKKKDGIVPDIEELVFLSPRLFGHLQRQGIKNISELESTTMSQWLRLPGFGRKSWQELKDLMKLYGLRFKEN